MPSTSKAALYMNTDTGGLGLSRLSDRILLDKWAMLWRGLHSDKFTRIATEGLLHRALRIGRRDTDTTFCSTFVDPQVPQLLTGLLQLMQSSGISLNKGGDPTSITSHQLISNALLLPLHSSIDNKLMNLRLTSLADLMIFHPDASNSWAVELLTAQFEDQDLRNSMH